jgi:hypothetical protein
MNEVEWIIALAVGMGIILALFGLCVLVFVSDKGGGRWRR